jgi:hypothetical protein
LLLNLYTGIRFRGVVKECYRKEFKPIALDGEWISSKVDFMQALGIDHRGKFIPIGKLHGTPKFWYRNFENHYDVKTGEWVFACSVDNCNGTIENFLSIVPKMIESVQHLEVLYEGYNVSTGYKLKDDKLERIQNFIEYKDGDF